MPHPIRRFAPGTIYHVVSRTLDELFLLAPDLATVQIFGATLAKTSKMYGVQIYAALAMSSHPHMNVGDPEGMLHMFMRDFLSQLARQVNKHLGRRGKFFAKRYTATPILDQDALLDRTQYTLCNPCNANLTDKASHWPGFSTLQQMLTGVPQRYELINWTRYHQARHRGEKVRPADFKVAYELELAPLPCWEHLSQEEQRQRLQALVNEGEDKARAIRRAEGKRVMPRWKLKKIRWTERSRNPKRSPQPLCHTTDRDLFFAYRRDRYLFVHSFRDSSSQYRNGAFDVAFPKYAVRPPLLTTT